MNEDAVVTKIADVKPTEFFPTVSAVSNGFIGTQQYQFALYIEKGQAVAGDVVKPNLLYHFGGIYADCKHEAVSSLEIFLHYTHVFTYDYDSDVQIGKKGDVVTKTMIDRIATTDYTKFDYKSSKLLAIGGDARVDYEENFCDSKLNPLDGGVFGFRRKYYSFFVSHAASLMNVFWSFSKLADNDAFLDQSIENPRNTPMTTAPNPIFVMPSAFRPKWPINEENMVEEEAKDVTRLHFFDSQPSLMFARMKVGKTWIIRPQDMVCPEGQNKPDGSNAGGPTVDDVAPIKTYILDKIKARNAILHPPVQIVVEAQADVIPVGEDDGEQAGCWTWFTNLFKKKKGF